MRGLECEEIGSYVPGVLALTSMVGRDRELGGLRERVRDSSIRLLTVTGPPGVGKSRLVAAAHRESLGDMAACVRFLDLASTPGARDLHGVFLESLEVAEFGGEAAPGREVLLIIDHGDCFAGEVEGLVTDSLAAHPGLRIILCGREPLHVYGERLFVLHPLEVPGAQPPVDLAEFARIASVRLFLERAAAARPDLVLTSRNREVIAELCNRLDGLPLAIELAAARLRLFEPEALLNRLRAGVDVLRGPASHTLSRHRSMNGAIAASYERLAEPEQHLLRRLALFSDDFDLDEAEAVSELPADILHDRLQSLAERGLVRVMAGEDGEPYFSLLNTIRGFALNEAARTGRTGADPVLRPATAGGGGLAVFRPEVVPLPRLGLTHREHQVAVLVAEGMTNRQIARQLGIAEWTAVNHVRNVMRKLECSSRVNVASLIAQAGLTG